MLRDLKKKLRDRLADEESKQVVACPHCHQPGRHYSASLGMRRPGWFFRRCNGCGFKFDYQKSEVVSLLEKNTKSCGATTQKQAETDSDLVVYGKPCNCRFCEECHERLGICLREEVREVIKDWKSPRLWTLTVDPELFDSPEEAFRYVREKRCISELMRSLRKFDYIGKHYFAVIEYHKNGWPHWHFIVDAKALKIPHEYVLERWGKFRPAEAGEPRHADSCDCEQCGCGTTAVRKRPAFGGVNFAPHQKFQNGTHAANYITKYLVKAPKEGYPDWVLDLRGVNVARYQTSRGFFAGVRAEKPKRKEKEEGTKAEANYETTVGAHGDLCMCKSCLEGEEPQDEFKREGRAQRSARERVQSCRTEGVLLRQWQDGARTRFRFISQLVFPMAECLRMLGVEEKLKQSSVAANWAAYFTGKVDKPPTNRWDSSPEMPRGQLQFF